MKKIAFAGYRTWALDILWSMQEYASRRGDVEFTHLFLTKDDFDEWVPDDTDLIVFAGWSWIIPNDIINKYTCICIHPSDLPAFAGGSPIQNQILRGVTDSAVTVFKMNEELDAGPIYMKSAISLLGPIDEVFQKIALTARPMMRCLISDLANDELKFYEQAKTGAKPHKRKKPKDSKISAEEIKTMSFSELERMVNVLGSPYPVVKIDGVTPCTSALKYVNLPENKPYVQVSDGFAVINQ